MSPVICLLDLLKGVSKMKKMNIVAALLIILTVSFNLISLKVCSQSTEPLDTYTITLVNKDGKTSLNSPTTALNIKVAPGGQDVSGLNTGVSLKATGATSLLTNVDITANIITVVWSGGISDGKAIITGKLKQGSTVAPNFIVTKVEKDGGTNITDDLNITVSLSSSASPPSSSSSSSGSSVSSSSSSGGITALSSSGGSTIMSSEPSITLSGPEEFIVKKPSLNNFKLKVKGANFTAATRCQIEVSDDSLLRVKPRRFILNTTRISGTLLAKVPGIAVKDLINNNSSDIVTVDVSCSNDASDSIDIILTAPDAE